jgi:hypothetical protein
MVKNMVKRISKTFLMENFFSTKSKLLFQKRVVIKIINNELTGKKRRAYHTVPTTLPTTITGFHAGS